MNEFLDIFMEAGVDTLKLIPFLFLTYILMEWLEHRTGSWRNFRYCATVWLFGSSIKSVFRWFDYGGRFGGCLFVYF